VLGWFVPPHGVLAPVDCEQVVGESVREVVEVGEVDRCELALPVGHRPLF
jgi:hypothetical protein